MTLLRPAASRGTTRLDWLDSRHSFSFGGYYAPDWPCFRALKVINDDRVAPGAGFPPHPHRDMEILTYVLEGALKHEDSAGRRGLLKAAEAQRMSAGTGIRHSEYNASESEPLRFLQIWLAPGKTGLVPGYERAGLPLDAMAEGFALIAAPEGENGPLTIHRDARLYAACPGRALRLVHPLASGRYGWLHMARGTARLSDAALIEGDGVALEGPLALALEAGPGAEILLFDLA